MVHGPLVTNSANTIARKPLRVVVLEDNPAEARLLQELLLDVAVEMTCEFAGELWEVSQERLAAADCAVIDLGLPDSSGLEAVDWIRDLAPEIPIVVLTGIEDESIGLAAIEHGAQEFLVKHHSDGYTIASAIRFAVVRMDIQHSLDLQLMRDADVESSLLLELRAVILAMQTTQGWMRQPSVAMRMSEHVAAITAVTEKIDKRRDRPSSSPAVTAQSSTD
jgi:CheY-like chemotaxis protein